MQHTNNNNNVIANELNSIIISLADMKTDSVSESLKVIENKISLLEHLSHEMDIPELRALTHWMMLNTELDDKNKNQISILIDDGSYYNWMDILAMLLRNYDQSLLPVIYKTLTEPKWIVKPSPPLLRNLATWIDTARALASNQTEVEQDELIISDINTDESSLDIDLSNKHIFEEVETSVLEKNYENSEILKQFSENISDKTKAFTEKTSNYYDEIEDEIIIDTTEKLFSSNNIDNSDASSVDVDVDVDVDHMILIPNKSINDASDNNLILNEEDWESDDFSLEIDDIIMSLATISSESEDTFKNTEKYIAELQRLNMLIEISGYEALLPISNWCQQNLIIFAKNKSNNFQQFIKTGESWVWIELIKLSIQEPEEISTISELNSELSRDEWLEPLETKTLESLLLFLRNPQKNTNAILEDVTPFSNKDDNSNYFLNDSTSSSRNKEYTNLSFKWDDDVHPELLEVYFDETSENIKDICEYLTNIGSIDTSKEQRQDARRTAHTIKGGSAVVGITALSTYAYQLEKILDYAIEHKLPNESNELLHSAAGGIKDLYNKIKDNKPSPKDYSETLEKLTLCAEALEKLDDKSLELSTPVLPDFIKQQNTVSAYNENVTNSTDKNIKNVDIIEDSEVSNDLTIDEDSIRLKDSIIIEDTLLLEVSHIVENSNSIDENIDTDTTTVKAELLNDKSLEPLPQFKIEEDTLTNIKGDYIEQNHQTENSQLTTLNQSDDLADFTAELDDIVMTLITTEVQIKKKPFNLDNYITELQRLDMLADISGYPEIVTISHWYQNNLKLIAKKGTKQLGEFITSGKSWAWIELVSASLADSSETSYLSELNKELTRPEWIDTLNTEQLQALLLVLTTSSNNLSEDTQERETEVIQNNISSTAVITSEAKDNIVTWDDDVHPELLSVYLQETSEQVSKIAELLHLIAKGKASKEQQENAARIAHTIKGASGVVGINEIVDFTHRLEDILDYAVNNTIPADTAELLAESSDCLESLFEAVQDKSTAPEEFEPLLAKLTIYAKTLEGDIDCTPSSNIDLEMPELPDFISSSDNSLMNDNPSTIDETPNEKHQKNNLKETTLEINELEKDKTNEPEIIPATTVSSKNSPTSESHIRVPIALINKLLNIAGELVTASSQVSDKIDKTLEISDQIKTQDIRVHDILEELSSTIYKQEKDQITMLSSMQNKEFDTLEMDTYNELHSVAGLLTESILDSETIENTLTRQLKDIHNNLRLVENLNKELSETILSSRMESLNTLIPRLERIVRQTCRKTNKEAELIVTGNDINIDTDILSGLVDPLLHLLRNAIDHGIETPETRKTKKKSTTGQIKLNFSRQGNFILMQLKDDGAGINSEKIYQHAINKGLITPDQEFSENEVLKLILEPGFSTQTNVTDISGRGVGMDVVNKGIEALKGSLTISSELDEGSCFNIKIPLTLVTSSTLLVEVADNKVAIPTDSIEQIFYLSPEDVLSRDENKYIRHEGKELVIESLAGILGWTVSDIDFSKAHTLLLIKGSQRLHAIYIDQIIHSREVVIKSLAHFIDSTKGVIGACHLSDGEVAPVMNLPQLISLNEKSRYKVKHIDESEIRGSETELTPQILVVDDSLSNRKALSLIIDKTEYDVITAVDGLDALNVMNERHIDLVFTDLEMPRMTGLELTQAIRAWNEKKETPIVMITSRSTNKHRELAKRAGVNDYLTKPVGTDTLLESMETWLKQTVNA